ncbi:MAG: GNAT family N-acetyltransferase [Candidatus Eisenbacteria bacterium]|uniref:GNAT family N-acetyltransferase n=1 Tax=Eiseniibacteriota bacterium TaxID=2212470 RepID=A0A956M1C3_UNCEI|nr:GNAT family N-acetyltransferase [Candidatus Eisenbacteria bacterium]
MGFEWGDAVPVLTGPRIILRPLRDADVEDLFEIYSHVEVMRYWTSPAHRERAETEKLVAEIRRGFEEGWLFEWGIADRTTDRVIGTATLFHVDWAHRRAEIGYALGRAEWGAGYASEALTVLIGFAFEKLDLHRLEADADPRNERSLRVLARQGFRREGTQLERYWLLGEIQDAALLGLLRHEWTPPGGENPPALEVPAGRVARSALLGSWDLVDWSVRLQDGTESHPFGEGGRGRLVYDDRAQVWLHLQRSTRPPFESGDPFGGTPEEIAAAFHGFLSYYGEYEVDVETATVRHRILGSSFPNWEGTTQERRYTFVGEELVITATPDNVTEGPRAGAVHTLRWRRSPRPAAPLAPAGRSDSAKEERT